MKQTTFIFVAAAVVTAFTPTTEASGQGSPIRFGWGSEIRTVGAVDPASELGREMGETKASVAQTWEWFWLALPVWSCNREYIVHERVAKITDDTIFWELKSQSPEELSRISGVPESELKFPFYYFAPPGWIALAVLLGTAQLMSGPSPKKRFTKLTSDDDYVHAIHVLSDSGYAIDDDDADELTNAELETMARQRFDSAVAYLAAQGIAESKAKRNLEFLIGYLNSHPNVSNA